MALDQLDQKLWVALACPVDNVHFDTRTLSLIDTDGDRRVRAAELIAAIQWTAALLKNPDDLVSSEKGLPLQAINDATEEGKALAAAGRNAAAALGKQQTGIITVEDVESLDKVLSIKPFNGDGVITEEAAPDEALRGVIREIIAALGAATDRSGNPGITAEKVEAFFTRVQEFEKWYAESERDPAIKPLGEATEVAAKAVAAVREKIEDYFARCAIAGFDDRSMAALQGGEKAFDALGNGPLSLQSKEIAALPLARVVPQSPLPLTKGLNPAWVEKMKTFESAAGRPLLGAQEALSESGWQRLLAALAPWFAWQERKPAVFPETLDIKRARELLKGPARPALARLIELDKTESAVFASLTGLEKLVRFHRDLHSLCTNFVNFKDFYANKGEAIFKAGTLYLDQRSCGLCLKVGDPGKHSLMAAMAGTHLVYCECRRPGGAKTMNIVAAFTNGDSENLIVGRNGVFYDRAGNDWDATITKIIENPISLRQAFWMPYKSLVRMIESQVAKRASAADAQSKAKLEQTAAVTANLDKSAPAAPPKNLDIGVVAALGVAAGALGTFVATLMGYTSGIIRLGPLAIIGALIGVLLVISGPSLILAYIKLRKRNLGPILDANGWAINAKARINVPFGNVLTHVATLPPGSQRDLTDPYAEKKSPWPRLIILAIIIYAAYAGLDHFGYINTWSRGFIGHKRAGAEKAAVIGNVPAQAAPASK